MHDKKWTHAAWMAIGAAALTPANVLLSFVADLTSRRGPGIAVTATQTVRVDLVIALLAVIVGASAATLSLIALYRFRELLNERYAYHGIDALVTFAIIAIAVLTFVSIGGRMAMALLGVGENAIGVAIVFVIPIMLLGVAIGIVSIVLGFRLFSLENDLQHLIRPYAVVSIIGGACFALIVLAPLGMLLLIAENILLALTFFRAGESEPTLEYV